MATEGTYSLTAAAEQVLYDGAALALRLHNRSQSVDDPGHAEDLALMAAYVASVNTMAHMVLASQEESRAFVLQATDAIMERLDRVERQWWRRWL